MEWLGLDALLLLMELLLCFLIMGGVNPVCAAMEQTKPRYHC